MGIEEIESKGAAVRMEQVWRIRGGLLALSSPLLPPPLAPSTPLSPPSPPLTYDTPPIHPALLISYVPSHQKCLMRMKWMKESGPEILIQFNPNPICSSLFTSFKTN